MTDSRRVRWIDTGRGVAIVFVALYHSARWLTKAGFDTTEWQAVNEMLSSLRMPLFFTLSGLFAGKWQHASWRSLLRSKLALFVWVFCVWEFIGSCAFVLGTAANGHRVSLWDTGIGLLVSPLLPRLELWFIWALTLFFVIAKLCRRINPWLQLGVAAAVSIVSLTVWINTTTGATGSAKYYFFFLAGIYLRTAIQKFGASRNTGLLVLVFVAWAAVSVTLSVLHLRGTFGLYFLNCLLGVLGGIALSRFLSSVSFLGWIGKRTLPIYLAHTPVIIVIAFALSRTSIAAGGGQDVLATPIVAGCAVALALAAYVWSAGKPLAVLYDPPRQVLDRVVPAVSSRVRDQGQLSG